MTANQIRKALSLAKINMENLTICRGMVKVYVRDEVSECDHDAIDELAEQIRNVLNWGGYSAGSGAWVFVESYCVATSEYCDVSSSHHY